MPLFDYSCSNKKCDFIEEYSTSPSVPKAMNPPKKCPKCKQGKLIQLFSAVRQGIDVIGGYDYQYGKKAWKKNMTSEEQAQVLRGEKEPY